MIWRITVFSQFAVAYERLTKSELHPIGMISILELILKHDGLEPRNMVSNMTNAGFKNMVCI